jgi:hypothetical protein
MPAPDSILPKINERGGNAMKEGDEMDAILALSRTKLPEYEKGKVKDFRIQVVKR